MPRGPRIDAPGAAHHVMVRGIERRDIFLDDLDRCDLLRRLDRLLPLSGLKCFAWVLMANHVHMVVQTGATPLGKVMQRVLTGYARYFNTRHGRSGHLVGNRYQSRPVGNDADLMGLIRYVHLNPHRAGICGSLSSLERYRWCGHGALVDVEQARRFHAVEQSCALLGPNGGEHSRAWMAEGIADRAVGLEREPSSESENEIPALTVGIASVCRSYGVDPAGLRNGVRDRTSCEARSAIAHVATRKWGYSCSAVAYELGVSASAIARAARRGAVPSLPA
jgi:putative transposase